jgi:hypothetical protein
VGTRFFPHGFNVFKLAGIRHRQPGILVVGSSRVMQIRDRSFQPLESEFYNAGGLLQSVFDLNTLAGMLVDGEISQPEVMIVGIDPWWLKSIGWDASWLVDDDQGYGFAVHLGALRMVARKLALGDLFAAAVRTDSPYFGYGAIGASARFEGSGFRKDGSHQRPPREVLEFIDTPVYVDRERPPVIERVRELKKNFAVPASVDRERVQLVIDSLSTMSDLGIEVHVFLPPFSSEVFQALDESEALKAWWDYYKVEFPALLEAEGFAVIPVAEPASLGLDDLYMCDGFHPSEVYMGHVVRNLVEAAPASSPLQRVDVSALSDWIDAAQTPLAFQAPMR